MSAAPVITQASAKHAATCIFLHGLGDTGHGWALELSKIKPANMKLVCPTAEVQPVTLNGRMAMPAWFDVYGLDSKSDQDEAGIRKAAKEVHEMITAEAQNGISTNHIVLGGFSQGGALALFSALTYNQPLAGVVALSSWLPLHTQFPALKSSSSDIPIFLAHGNADNVVSLKYGELTSDLLKGFMSNVTFKVYAGLGHSSSEEEMTDVKEFLQKSTN